MDGCPYIIIFCCNSIMFCITLQFYACSCTSDIVIVTDTENNTQSNQIPIVRLPSNTLLKYTAYKDVSILHFRVPMDTKTALFNFKAFEENKSAFRRGCKPRDVSLHIKAGSYPVISPENITFPRHFLSADQRYEIYDLVFKSDSQTQRLTIDGPQPGNWFAVAFISWTDPNNEQIKQQGIAASCETLLHSEMSVIRTDPVLLNGESKHKNIIFSNSSEPISYKFFVPRDIVLIKFKFNILKPCINDCTNITISANSNSLPTEKKYLQKIDIYSNQIQEYSIDFFPEVNSWHYININFDKIIHEENNTTNYTELFQVEFEVQLVFQSELENKKKIFDNYPLLRQTYREFFMFDYDLLPDINGTVPTSLNITTDMPSLFKFSVGDVYDIGGTLSFAVAMKEVLKNNYVFESLSSTTAVPEKIADKLDQPIKKTINNQTVIICIRLGEPGMPTWPDKCVYGRQTLKAASIINNTDTDTSTGLVHVPFPESGSWYVTMGVFCHGNEIAARLVILNRVKSFIKENIVIITEVHAQCQCAKQWNYYKDCAFKENCIKKLNETEILKIKECMVDSKCTPLYMDMSKKFEIYHKSKTGKLITSDSSCNTSVVFTISSSPCVAGRCGRYGRCYHYMSGGFVFSTCLCIKGYRGWDCTEDSEVPSSFSILIASLMLTLSNLLFTPSIYYAIRRTYYIEAIIYFFAMLFSAFYHACDSGEDEYSFCLVKIGVLQFCDFYCGLLAIWVTLIAMANIRKTIVSILHMFGAIMLAFGTELNKQSLWVFLAPALTGVCLISVSWGMKCRAREMWYPSRRYLAIHLPIGLVLSMIGLICYAFLQTKQNYHIVHSIWHMVMALSILCLLPNRKNFVPKC